MEKNKQAKKLNQPKTDSKEKNLIDEVDASFSEKSGINTTEFEIGDQRISIFYIESLIDKALFSSGILRPMEKLVSESKDGSNGEKLSETII